MQARKQDSKANWDLVEFNKAIRDSLLAYDPTTHISEQVSTRKNAVIQREILAKRTRKGLLLGIPKKVGEVINVNSIKHARAHTLERVDRSQRRKCIGCKIRGLPSRPHIKGQESRPVLGDITNRQANQEIKYDGRRRGNVLNIMCRYIFIESAGVFIIGQRSLVRIL
jgi:hypothetical protein